MNDDWTTFEQMSAGDLRRLADQMGSYDVVTVRVAPRLSPLAAVAKAGYDGEPADDPRRLR